MKAVTVRQPWAQAIAAGHKTVENRGRDCTYRGEIAIHAAQAVDRAGLLDPRIGKLLGPNAALDASRRAVVAVAQLVDCHRAEVHTWKLWCCAPWGDPFYGKPNRQAFHLVLRDVRVLRAPVPCRGMLQVGWELPADVEAQVRYWLPEVQP